MQSSEVSAIENFHHLHKVLILALVVVQGGVLALLLVPGIRLRETHSSYSLFNF